jgi:hypothetical protein
MPGTKPVEMTAFPAIPGILFVLHKVNAFPMPEEVRTKKQKQVVYM